MPAHHLGQFLLTGSASVDDPGRHSGAGRILRLRMRPMALAERGFDPSVSLADLLTGEQPAVRGDTAAGLGTYARAIVASGCPGIRRLSARVRRAQLDSYLDRIVDRDLAELGPKTRNPVAPHRHRPSRRSTIAGNRTS